jgi:hypothetical protein
MSVVENSSVQNKVEKKEIEFGTVVRVIRECINKGLVTKVCNIPYPHGFVLAGAGVLVFTEKDLEIVEIVEGKSVSVGDMVNVVSAHGIFTVVKTRTDYEVEDRTGRRLWTIEVVPISEEERAVHVAQRYEELRKKATAAIEELNAFSATLVKTSKPAPSHSISN